MVTDQVITPESLLMCEGEHLGLADTLLYIGSMHCGKINFV